MVLYKKNLLKYHSKKTIEDLNPDTPKFFHLDMSYVFPEPLNQLFNKCSAKKYLDCAWDFILGRAETFPNLYILVWCFIHIKRQISFVIGNQNLSNSMCLQFPFCYVFVQLKRNSSVIETY